MINLVMLNIGDYSVLSFDAMKNAVGYCHGKCRKSFVRSTVHNSRGADRGPRAPPLGLNPMHILLYPRVWTAEKIMLTEKKLGYTVHTSRLFKETHIQHDSKNFGGMAN